MWTFDVSSDFSFLPNWHAIHKHIVAILSSKYIYNLTSSWKFWQWWLSCWRASPSQGPAGVLVPWPSLPITSVCFRIWIFLPPTPEPSDQFPIMLRAKSNILLQDQRFYSRSSVVPYWLTCFPHLSSWLTAVWFWKWVWTWQEFPTKCLSMNLQRISSQNLQCYYLILKTINLILSNTHFDPNSTDCFFLL